MAEFYIEKNQNDHGQHLIHFSFCNLLQTTPDTRYLGSMASFANAQVEGKKLFAQVHACPTCAEQYASV